MKILELIALFFLSQAAFADCRGCCSGNGGVVCQNEQTKCGDGSELSAKCEAKSCNKCSSQSHKGAYSRKAFPHWVDLDGDCQNTRAELLVERSLEKVSFKKNKACTVNRGKWKDFYYDEVLTSAGDVDIDHIVPLHHAWQNGAKLWSRTMRREFANDPENLVITNLKYNRQKGAKSILEWMPINRQYACRYVEKWFYIKKKYKLTTSDKEKEYKSMLSCESVEFEEN